MSNIDIRSAKRPDWDTELADIADYVGPPLQQWVAIDERA